MTNEYSVTLDRNGYAPSIVQDIDGCWFCKTQQGKLDRHEIYHGAYRKKSKALGCGRQNRVSERLRLYLRP